VELEIAHDARGRPFLNPLTEALMPQVSISHAGDKAIAVASEIPLGIDLEPVDRDLSSILSEIATEEERAALQTLEAESPGGAWAVRLWCAKEAAGKALGTGLQGAPKGFQLMEADGEGRLMILHVETGRAFSVVTCICGEWMIAVARDADAIQESFEEWMETEGMEERASTAAVAD
jgi:phosphopantetheinyl transferase